VHSAYDRDPLPPSDNPANDVGAVPVRVYDGRSNPGDEGPEQAILLYVSPSPNRDGCDSDAKSLKVPNERMIMRFTGHEHRRYVNPLPHLADRHHGDHSLKPAVAHRRKHMKHARVVSHRGQHGE